MYYKGRKLLEIKVILTIYRSKLALVTKRKWDWIERVYILFIVARKIYYDGDTETTVVLN